MATITVLVLGVVGLAALNGPKSGGASLACRLEAAPQHKAGEPVAVRFHLKNAGQEPVAVLTWITPLEGLLGDVFAISGPGGKPVRYQGPQMKRGDPEADDYVTVQPGQEVSEEVEATLAYDLSTPGRYRITFDRGLHDVTSPGKAPRPRDAHQAAPLACPALEIEVVR